MELASQQKIEECFQTYCSVIKPLIAQIEATSEKIPLPVFNEIRAFNDHIARCYFNSPDEEYIKEQITKAQRHILRITLDCFKCLNVIAYKQIELFERQTRNIDLTVIDNGGFYPEYSRLKIEASKKVREAKIIETTHPEEALSLFEESYDKYSKIVEQIEQIREKVKWARARFKIRRWLTPVLWILSVIISAILSAIFSCQLVSRLFNYLPEL